MMMVVYGFMFDMFGWCVWFDMVLFDMVIFDQFVVFEVSYL